MTSDSLYTYSDFPSAWMRVLFRLYLARVKQERHTYGRHTAPAGYIPIHEVRGPEIGGSAGDVRLRLDLRRDRNVPIDLLEFKWRDFSGKKHTTPLYRLMCDLDDTDFAAILEEKSDWRYEAPTPVEAEQMEIL